VASLKAENAKCGFRDEESALVERAQQGDSAAFGLLVERYTTSVLTTLYYLTGDREEAEDLAQEVFLKAYTGLRTLRRGASFRNWLYRILHNVSASRWTYLRAQKRQGESKAAKELQAENAPAGSNYDPAKGVMNQELRAAIEEAIFSLDPESRELIVLRDLEDRSYEEISRITNLPLGTVKSRIHRTRLVLREKLKRYL